MEKNIRHKESKVTFNQLNKARLSLSSNSNSNQENKKSNNNSTMNADKESKMAFNKLNKARLSLSSNSNSNQENKKASNSVKKANDTLDSKKNKNSSITSPPSSDHAYSKKLTPSDKKNKETSSIVITKKQAPESTSNATSNISNKTPSKIHYDPNLNLSEKPNAKKKVQTPKTDQQLKKLINEAKKSLKATTTEDIKKQQVQADSFKIPKKLNENTEDNIENKTEPPSRPNNEIPKDSSPLKSTKPLSKATNEIPKETLDKTVTLSNPLKSNSNVKKTLPEKLLQKAITNSKNADKKCNDKTKIKSRETVSSSILENLNNPLITNNITEKVKQSVFQKTAPSILTLATFEAQRKEINHNIGIKNFFNNPLIFLQSYVNKLMNTQNLNFALLNSNLPQDNVSNVNYVLNRDEKIELRNLMSENAGRINVFDMYQFGESMALTNSWWNEFKPNEKVSSEEFRKRALFETLRECPISYCYQFYCAFRERNSTPFRHVDTYWSGNT